MPQQNSLPTTQRAYTLRLDRTHGECPKCTQADCACWRDALWQTHEAVNQGAKTFGDWLLTLRGGLDHGLADAEIPSKSKQSARPPTDGERRDRRILLALSWLSVEDARGAPMGDGLRVATGEDAPAARGKAVWSALRDILQGRGVGEEEIGDWLADCGPSLEASIRDDAVWVNRSACFDKAIASVGDTLTRDAVWDFLEPFFGTRAAYFSGIAGSKEEAAEAGEATRPDEKAKDLVQKAGQWLSSRFGTGKGADFSRMSAVYDAIVSWGATPSPYASGSAALESLATSLGRFKPASLDANGIMRLISGPGYKSATREIIRAWGEHTTGITTDDISGLTAAATKDREKCEANTDRKGRRPWADPILKDVERVCGFTYLQTEGAARHAEFAVMLDHAARRVSLAHTWIKRAESERQKFKADATKIADVPSGAKSWLDRYCEERFASSGASDAYRIRKRALGGWKEVVAKWGRATCKTEDDRIAAAREVQADPEVEKFGDIHLFEALAADDAVCVWRNEGKSDTSILTDYVAGTTAAHNQTRFKVPAYRHPDALRHPVFCDFGKSRWKISFACHEARNGKKRVAKADAEWIKDRHGLRMGLWDGRSVEEVGLRWSSKRLMADLALDDSADGQRKAEAEPPVGVTRADRLGRAASSAFGQAAILNVFEEKYWNGRLQAPREQLDRIALLKDKGNHGQANVLRQRLHWLVSFSPRLNPSGPFIKYAEEKQLLASKKDIKLGPKNERDEWRGLAFPFWHPSNKSGRKGHAKHLLSRLTGLRVLSVDLGHRHAAACAVWEALSSDTFKTKTAGLPVRAHGSGGDDLYRHVEEPGKDGKPRTVIYRRIGSDTLPDGSDHPAPWARLDRQFLIKLQGEEEPARKASTEETDRVRGWEKALGRVRDGAADPLPHPIDRLLSEAVTLLTRALRQHGDRARIAFNLTTQVKLTPGGGQERLNREGRVELLTKTLALWHGLFGGERWADSWAADEWERRGLPEIIAPDDVEEVSGAARKKRHDALEAALKPHAERLADQDLSAWSSAWAERWRRDNEAWSGKDGILRTLKRWIAPRGLRPLPADDAATRERKKTALAGACHVGGLSLTRINNITALYQLLKAFKMRPEPADLRKNIPEKGDDALTDFNRRLLEMRDRLREQRVKQLASRIVEAALGVGRIQIPTKGKRPARPREAVDAPCHAVVIESLTHYRPDELQTRRENRMLMEWSSSKVQKFLGEGCQLHGLHLREVTPNYTSQQCSRTGLPGVRCTEVSVEDFLTKPWCRKAVKTARKKVEKDSTDTVAHFFVDLADCLDPRKSDGQPLPSTVRVPRKGGDLFVAASQTSNGVRRALQADLNAAANIGLRALMDPDFPGRWWYVPCRDADATPDLKKVTGSTCFSGDAANFGALRSSKDAPPPDDGDKPQKAKKSRDSGKKSKEITNYWRDPSSRELRPAGQGGFWLPTPAYWSWVRKRAIAVLREANGLSAAAPEAGEEP